MKTSFWIVVSIVMLAAGVSTWFQLGQVHATRLSPQQIEQFEQLMLAAEEEKMDLQSSLRTQRPGKDAAE